MTIIERNFLNNLHQVLVDFKPRKPLAKSCEACILWRQAIVEFTEGEVSQTAIHLKMYGDSKARYELKKACSDALIQRMLYYIVLGFDINELLEIGNEDLLEKKEKDV